MSDASPHVLAVLGLGHMGRPIAANLVAAGLDVRTWNRSGGTVDGGKACATIAEAVHGADVVVTMLADDVALKSVTFGDGKLIASLRRAGVHLSMSTISRSLAEELDIVHREAGQRFVACPVFGRPEAAASRKLWLVPGGAAADLQYLSGVFNAVGQGVFSMPRPADAALAKLCGNFLIAATIESVAEALTLGEKGGIPAEQLLAMFTGTLFGSPVVQRYGGMIARTEFSGAGFGMALGLKDARLVLEAGEELHTPMPVAGLVRDRFLAALARGRADEDWAGLAGVVREEAGLPARKT